MLYTMGLPDAPPVAVVWIVSGDVNVEVVLAGAVKVIVCVPCVTVKLCVTGLAALYVPFAGWLAVIEHVPGPTNVITPPLVTEHTVGVDDEYVTG